MDVGPNGVPPSGAIVAIARPARTHVEPAIHSVGASYSQLDFKRLARRHRVLLCGGECRQVVWMYHAGLPLRIDGIAAVVLPSRPTLQFELARIAVDRNGGW